MTTEIKIEILWRAARTYSERKAVVVEWLRRARQRAALFQWEARGGIARVGRALNKLQRRGQIAAAETAPIGGGNTQVGQVAWLLENEGPRKRAELSARLGTPVHYETLKLLRQAGRIEHKRTAKYVVWQAVRGVAAGLVMLLMVGCASPNARQRPTVNFNETSSKLVVAPPLPPVTEVAAMNTRTVTRTAIAPPPPKATTISLAWEKNHPGAITEVWSGPTIFNRTVNLRSNVVGSSVTLPCNQTAEFYRIRNRVGGHVSKWHDEGK
jgi:hypothetical protein